MNAHVFGMVHHLDDDSNTPLLLFSGCIHHSEIYKVMCSMSPPVGFGKKCPKIVGYKVCTSIFLPYHRKYSKAAVYSAVLHLAFPSCAARMTYDAYSSCVYRENVSDSCDIPVFTTREHCITRIFLLFMIKSGHLFSRHPSFGQIQMKNFWLVTLVDA